MELLVFFFVNLYIDPIIFPVRVGVARFAYISKLEQVLENHKVSPLIVRTKILKLA